MTTTSEDCCIPTDDFVWFYVPNMKAFLAAAIRLDLSQIGVITNKKFIEEFFVKLNVPVIMIGDKQDLTYRGLVARRDKLKGIAMKINNQKVFNGVRGFDVWGLYFLKLLSRNNTVYYESFDNSWPKASYIKSFFTNKFFRRYVLDGLILYSITGTWYTIYKLNDTSFYHGIDDKELLKIFVKPSLKEDVDVFVKNVERISEHIPIPICDILIVEERAKMLGQFDKMPLRDFIDWCIAEKLHVVVKTRPDSESTNECFSMFPRFTENIPTEFFLGRNKITIGMHSNSLKLLSSHSKAISLIELADSYTPEYRKSIKDIIISKMGDVEMPSSVEELKSMVLQQLKQKN